MITPSDERAREKRQSRQLTRLETLVDCVYAVVLVVAVTMLPKPDESDAGMSAFAFLRAHGPEMLFVLLGLIFVVIYWLRSNKLFGNLERTDAGHTALSIVQTFLLLFYLFALRLGLELGRTPSTRALESIAAALVGFAGATAWWYASGERRLLAPEVSREAIARIQLGALTEPVTAVITIPFAYVGPIAWELSWLSYVVVFWVFNRRAKGASSSSSV